MGTPIPEHLQRRVLYRGSKGRYEWCPILQIVEYFPPRAQRSTWSYPLDIRQNTHLGAYSKALRHAMEGAWL